MHNFTCLHFDSTGTDVTDFDDFWEPSDSVYVVGLRYDLLHLRRVPVQWHGRRGWEARERNG